MLGSLVIPPYRLAVASRNARAVFVAHAEFVLGVSIAPFGSLGLMYEYGQGVPQDYAGRRCGRQCRGQPLLVSPPTRIVVAVSPDAKGVEAAKAAERPSAEITTGA